MANYAKIVDFAAKDALNTGDPVKLVKGTEIGAEYDAISVAIATKANTASPAFTGVSSFAVGAVGAPSIYMTGYATTGWYNIGANNWGFAVSGAKVLDIASTGLSVTGALSASSDVEWSGAVTQTSGSVVPVSTVANTIGGSSKRTTFTQNTDGSYVIDNDTAGNGSAPRFVVKVGTVEKASISPTGLAVTGTLSATGTSSLARIDQSNGSINFSSFGNGSTSWQIGTVTAGKPLDIFTGGVVRAQFSDNGLAVTGDISVSTKTPASAAAAGVAGTITWDASYIYVCTATNTWKRVAIATW